MSQGEVRQREGDQRERQAEARKAVRVWGRLQEKEERRRFSKSTD